MSKNLTLDGLKNQTEKMVTQEPAGDQMPQEIKSLLEQIPSKEDVDQLINLLAAVPHKRKSRKRVAAPPRWGVEARSVRKSILITPAIEEAVTKIAEEKQQSFNNAVEEALKNYIRTEGFSKK